MYILQTVGERLCNISVMVLTDQNRKL